MYLAHSSETRCVLMIGEEEGKGRGGKGNAVDSEDG
jgi:hypothetical protein